MRKSIERGRHDHINVTHLILLSYVSHVQTIHVVRTPDKSTITISSSISNCFNAKDFNLRIVSSRTGKKFKMQNAHHVVLRLYLKMQVICVHHAQKVKAMLTAIADAAADTSNSSRYCG